MLETALATAAAGCHRPGRAAGPFLPTAVLSQSEDSGPGKLSCFSCRLPIGAVGWLRPALGIL